MIEIELYENDILQLDKVKSKHGKYKQETPRKDGYVLLFLYYHEIFF